jgi:hypothetical protein
VVVGSRYFRFGIFLERVLGTVLRDDRDSSLHLHVSRIVDRIHWVLDFCSFLLGFYLRDLLPIPMLPAPVDAGVVFVCLFWTVWSCIYIYYCFVYSVIDLFYSLAFRTHVSSCVRGGD